MAALAVALGLRPTVPLPVPLSELAALWFLLPLSWSLSFFLV